MAVILLCAGQIEAPPDGGADADIAASRSTSDDTGVGDSDVPRDALVPGEAPSGAGLVANSASPEHAPEFDSRLTPLRLPALKSDERIFGDRIMRPGRTIMMRVTAYSPDARSCPGTDDGITASGCSVLTNGGCMVAADTKLLPFGSVVSVPGYDEDRPVPVLDRGGAIKGLRLDVLYPTHEMARKWGVKFLPVTIWDEVGRITVPGAKDARVAKGARPGDPTTVRAPAKPPGVAKHAGR